jgi:hypothetical protein
LTLLLFKVEQVFFIAGVGCVVTPGIEATDSRVRIGDALLLKLPGGGALRTAVRGLEVFEPINGHLPLLLGAEIAREQVPPGTEVWLE